MSYMRHHGILVTSVFKESAQEAYKKAQNIFNSAIISPLQESVINNYYSFAIFPDGSEEGLEESNVNDVAREEFIKWMNKQRYEDNSTSLKYVCVQYGDSNCQTKVIADSEEILRKDGNK